MKEEELHPIAVELHILAGMLAKMGRRDLEQRLESRGLCLTGLGFGILRLLSHGEHTISEIGRQMMISPPTLVPVIDSLERQGLVRRGVDAHDRRRTPLNVTEEGADLLRRVPVVDSSDALVRSLEAMGPAKASQLLELTREAVDTMWRAEHPEARDSVVEAVTASVREQFGTMENREQRTKNRN